MRRKKKRNPRRIKSRIYHQILKLSELEQKERIKFISFHSTNFEYYISISFSVLPHLYMLFGSLPETSNHPIHLTYPLPPSPFLQTTSIKGLFQIFTGTGYPPSYQGLFHSSNQIPTRMVYNLLPAGLRKQKYISFFQITCNPLAGEKRCSPLRFSIPKGPEEVD